MTDLGLSHQRNRAYERLVAVRSKDVAIATTIHIATSRAWGALVGSVPWSVSGLGMKQ